MQYRPQNLGTYHEGCPYRVGEMLSFISVLHKMMGKPMNTLLI